MKAKFLFVCLCLALTCLLIGCGSSDKTPDETINPLGNSVKTEAPQTETQEPEATQAADEEWPNPDEYDFFHVFKAPEGNPRDIVINHMLDMSKIAWTPTETWTTTWKGEAEFKVNLTYEKGKTYYGIPYGRTNATLDEFAMYVTPQNTFTPNSPYYEEIVGNHCSSSMVMAFQQIIPMVYSGGLKPITSRTEFLQFPSGVEIPPSRTEGRNDDWISETVFAHNGQDAIFEGYAQLDKGDILYKNIDGSGHTRMVSKVEVYRTAAGKLMPGRSYVYCIEQTNAWADNKKESTWFIDRQYSFKNLYDTLFMPVSLCIYHEENPVIKDAYISFEGKNTSESIKKMVNGTIESNFPLAYAKLYVTDKDGNVVAEHLEYYLTKSFKINLRNFTYKLGIEKLPAGDYTFNLRAGIARGGVDIEKVDFTIS